MGIPDHLTCLLKNLYADQEATVRIRLGKMDWFQIGKRVHQGCILSLCLFNFYAEYIMWNAGLDEAQAGIKIARRNTITSDMQMTPPLLQKLKRNWRASWWNERGKWKSWLKTQHSKTKTMASGPITSWQIDGETLKQWETLFSWTPKSLQMVTVAVNLRHLLLGRKAMTNLDSVLKIRDIT